MKKTIAKWTLGVWVALSMFCVQADEIKDPYEIVDVVTVELMQVVRRHVDTMDKSPDEYYQAIGQLLDPVVDFDFIARAVMGPYFKQATEAQQHEFARVFKTSLISTYSKGIAGFSDLKMKVLPAEEPLGDKRRVSVLQEVTGGEKIHRVYYTMALNREGEWKLINMVLNGVNLGETLRNQFVSSMRREENLDVVITRWGVSPTIESKQDS